MIEYQGRPPNQPSTSSSGSSKNGQCCSTSPGSEKCGPDGKYCANDKCCGAGCKVGSDGKCIDGKCSDGKCGPNDKKTTGSTDTSGAKW